MDVKKNFQTLSKSLRKQKMSLVAESVLLPCGWSTNKNPWIKNPGANISTRKRPIYREINQ